MNISQYEAFIKTIELKSLTKAAGELGYTQSGITHMLDSLEKECNLKLLFRDRKGATATSDGERMLPYFEAVCNSQHDLKSKLNEIRRLEDGLIRIGTFPSCSAQWLPGIIKMFRSDYPKIQFEFVHGTNQELENWLIKGRLDCAFVFIPANKKLEAIHLRKDRILAVLPENHPMADASVFPILSLPQYPYIKQSEMTESEVTEVLRSYNVTPDVQFIDNDIYAVVAMVEKGLGISLVSELVLKDSPRKIIRKELDIPACRELGVATRNSDLLSVSTKKFLEYVKIWISKEYSG